MMSFFLLLLLSILSIPSSASFLHSHTSRSSNAQTLAPMTWLTPSSVSNHPYGRKRNFPFVIYAKKESKSYQFGDITKTLIKKVTKKDKYEFGDLSRHLDKVAKQKVAELNEKEKYEFGDLARYIDSKVKGEIQEFTNSTGTNKKYQFGDISKEIVRRVVTKDYTLDDMIFLFKILLAFGAGLSPVANFLPAKLLIELLDVSIAGDATKRVTAAITSELDKRMKKAFTGDENYQLGDMSKKKMLDYIGKDKYEFGDVSRFVLEAIDEDDKGKKEEDGNIVGDATQKKLSLKGKMLGADEPNSELISKELEEWDKKFLTQLNADSDAVSDKSDGKGRQRQ